MLLRGRFIELLLSTLAVPAPVASPASRGDLPADPWAGCTPNPELPFNRPLELTMEVLDGPPFDLFQYRGSVVLMNMFATWCPPCREEIPALVDAAHRYASRGLRVIGIDSAEPDDTVRTFRKHYGMDYPIAMDRKGEFIAPMETMHITGDLLIPASYFITPYGYLSCYRPGSMSADELNACIEALLPDVPQSTPSSEPSPKPSPLPSGTVR